MAETNVLAKKFHVITKYIQSREQAAESNSTVQLIKTAELSALKIHYRDIAALIDAGYLEKVKQGCYKVVFSKEISEPSEASIIASLFPDGVLCMYTALFYYGYSDRTPLSWDIAIDRDTSKARFKIDYPYVQPYYMKPEHLTYGITTAEYEDCHMQIFDRDRLICECIKNENKMDRESYNKAIQGYVADSKKSIVNLLSYAKKRNIAVKVKDRIGVWL
jgi:predicted transcriptional regulator of viral defense system